VRVGDIELAVRPGSPGPTMVWGHGLLASMAAEDEAGLFDWSSSEHAVNLVRYDARGHGESTAPRDDAGYRWDRLAGDMLGVADAVGASRFVAGGASMGAATALHAAVAAPERVAALVLVIPPTAWKTRSRQSRQYRFAAVAIDTLGVRPFALAARVAPSPRLLAGHEPSRRSMLHGLDHLDRRVAPHVLRGAAASDLPPIDRLRRIEVPTLVLAWEGDPVHPPSSASAIADAIAGSRLSVAASFDDVRGWPGLVASFLGEVAHLADDP
jgi:pimeloyl-ACP methyl ester carboxylesterase